jgi:alpha-galactosidase
MSVLTNVFYKTSKLKTVGLCHGVFETIDALKRILGFECREDCKLEFAGVNHFFWILDFDVNGADGYELLKEKTGKKKLNEIIPELDPLFCRLYEQFGYLSYSEDRHTCEFFPQYLTGDIKKLEKHRLKRTTIDERKGWMRDKAQELDEYISGSKKLPDTFSGEAAAGIIGAIAANRSRVDVVNVPNEGQIPNLPLGTIVETMGVIDGLGFRPLHAGKLPEPMLSFVLPHALNQNLIIEASLEGDLDKALYALYTDPLCAHLDFDDIKEMGMKLLNANKKYLPQFKI